MVGEKERNRENGREKEREKKREKKREKERKREIKREKVCVLAGKRERKKERKTELEGDCIPNSCNHCKKKAIRFMTNSSYIAHTAPLLIRHGLLHVHDMFKLKFLSFTINFYMVYYHHILSLIVNYLRKFLLVICITTIYMLH